MPELAGWRRLGCAILLRAYKDAAAGNGHALEARQFLASPAARGIVKLLGLDAGGLERVLFALDAQVQGGTLSEPGRDQVPGSFTAAELALAIVAAERGEGWRRLANRLEAAGLPRPRQGRAMQVAAAGKVAREILRVAGYEVRERVATTPALAHRPAPSRWSGVGNATASGDGARG